MKNTVKETRNITELLGNLATGIVGHEMISALTLKLVQHQQNLNMINSITSILNAGLPTWIDSETGEMSNNGYECITSMLYQYDVIKQQSIDIIDSLEDAMNQMNDKMVKAEDGQIAGLQMVASLKESQNMYFSDYDVAINAIRNLIVICENNKKLNMEEKEMKKTVTINADVFIIPNSLNMISQSFHPERLEKSTREICELSNIDFDINTKLVQCWFTNDKSDNLVDHCSKIDIDDEEWIVTNGKIPQYIPVSFFKGLKEGDTVDITVPVKVIKDFKHCDNKMNINLCIHTTLNQLSYRYKRFGAFEKVLSDLCI